MAISLEEMKALLDDRFTAMVERLGQKMDERMRKQEERRKASLKTKWGEEAAPEVKREPCRSKDDFQERGDDTAVRTKEQTVLHSPLIPCSTERSSLNFQSAKAERADGPLLEPSEKHMKPDAQAPLARSSILLGCPDPAPEADAVKLSLGAHQTVTPRDTTAADPTVPELGVSRSDPDILRSDPDVYLSEADALPTDSDETLPGCRSSPPSHYTSRAPPPEATYQADAPTRTLPGHGHSDPCDTWAWMPLTLPPSECSDDYPRIPPSAADSSRFQADIYPSDSDVHQSEADIPPSDSDVEPLEADPQDAHSSEPDDHSDAFQNFPFDPGLLAPEPDLPSLRQTSYRPPCARLPKEPKRPSAQAPESKRPWTPTPRSIRPPSAPGCLPGDHIRAKTIAGCDHGDRIRPLKIPGRDHERQPAPPPHPGRSHQRLHQRPFHPFPVRPAL